MDPVTDKKQQIVKMNELKEDLTKRYRTFDQLIKALAPTPNDIPNLAMDDLKEVAMMLATQNSILCETNKLSVDQMHLACAISKHYEDELGDTIPGEDMDLIDPDRLIH